jgi:acetyl-CoA acetyltransferase
MTAWGKWGRPFVDYGTAAAREALDDAGVDWADVDLIVGGETVRNGYAGYVAGSTVAAALGFNGAQVATVYGACASGAMAIDHGRAHIMAGLADVVLVVGADTTPKGFLAPNAGERPDDPDWLRFRLLGATNPAYFGLYARRRMHLHGATESDFAKVKVKNSRHGVDNPRARYRKEVAEEEVLASPIVASPLHLLDICATSDGAAAVVLCSADYAARRSVTERTAGRPQVRIAAVSTVTPVFPDTGLGLPDIATDSTAVMAPPPRSFRDSIAHTAYEQAGIGPEDVDVAEVYDLSTALELDWYENLGLCAPGEAEQLIRRRRRHRQPVRRTGLLRGGRPRPGHRPGVRARVAAPGRRPRPPGRRRPRRHLRQPGPVRARLLGDRAALTGPGPNGLGGTRLPYPADP